MGNPGTNPLKDEKAEAAVALAPEPTRQSTINLVFRNFVDAGDDEENAAARLALLDITPEEIEVASKQYAIDTDEE